MKAFEEKRWPRLVGHEFDFVTWGFSDVGLPTAPIAAPCSGRAGMGRAQRYAFSISRNGAHTISAVIFFIQ